MSHSLLSTHDRLVSQAVLSLRRRNSIQIKADHLPELTRPAEIDGFVPDITALYAGTTVVIVEAETSEGLRRAHTIAQWRAFHIAATRADGYFIIVVSTTDYPAACNLARRVCSTAKNVRVWAID